MRTDDFVDRPAAAAIWPYGTGAASDVRQMPEMKKEIST
jgi:hypothetical protein